MGVFVDEGSQPGWDTFPVLADVEAELCDCAVKAVEAVDVFVVVEGGLGHGEALIGDGVLELCYLGVFFEVILFYFGVFRFYKASQ